MVKIPREGIPPKQIFSPSPISEREEAEKGDEANPTNQLGDRYIGKGKKPKWKNPDPEAICNPFKYDCGGGGKKKGKPPKE